MLMKYHNIFTIILLYNLTANANATLEAQNQEEKRP